VFVGATQLGDGGSSGGSGSTERM